jgi:hypothetical protein
MGEAFHAAGDNEPNDDDNQSPENQKYKISPWLDDINHEKHLLYFVHAAEIARNGSLHPRPLYFNILTLSIEYCYKKTVTNLWVVRE